MWDILLTSINAIVPIILLILLGYILKRCNFLSQDFIKIGNKFVFMVCLPCMLFINIYDNMNSFADIRWDVIIYSVIVICVIFGFGLLTAILTTKKSERRGVILQCIFRSNFAIIGLSLVERLGGDAGIASIVSAFSIPIFNILAVISLSIFNIYNNNSEDEGEVNENKLNFGQSSKKILFNIIRNPLIIGVAVGLVFVGIREIQRACTGGEIVFRLDTQLKFIYIAIKDLKLIASPLALVVLGGQFEFSAVKGMTKEIVVGTVWRVVLAPLVGVGCAVLLSTYTNLFTFGIDVYPTLIALFGTPVAVSSAIMAAEMKNDEQLATQLVVFTSVSSIFTIFATVFILMLTGLLVV